MIRTALVAALSVLAFTAGSALAQPMGESPAMPDPRQMSGIPRGEPKLPPGTLTVRVIQGSIVMNAPAGTPVHLVTVTSGGDVSMQTAPVNDEGRAVFEKLETDGSAAYYALALLPRGETQDRLASQLITMPPQVGIAVMLAGLAPDDTAPAIDDHSGPNIPTPPAGEVVVQLTGDPRGIANVRLVEVGDARNAVEAPLAHQDRSSTATFTGLADAAGKVYIAEAVLRGHVYRSAPFQLTAAKGAYTGIFVWPTLIHQFHAGAEIDDNKLWFQVQFTLANGAGAPYDPGADGIVIPLPRGFVGASVRDQDAARVSVDKDRGFIWRGHFPPGQRSFVGTFALPIEDGEVDMVMPLPFGALQSQVLVRYTPGMQVSTTNESAAPPRMSKLEGEQRFMVVSNIAAPADDTLRVTFKGLPEPPAWWGWSALLAGVSVVGFVGLAIAGVFTRRARAADAGGDEGAQQLVLERDRLYDKLVRLEKQHRANRLDGPRYDKARAAIAAELAGVIDALRERHTKAG